jgi:hypothetical protein
MGANKEAIAATLDLLVELSNSVAVSVPLDDFADWLEALGREDFHVCRTDGKPDVLTVFSTAFHRGKYVAVDTKAADIVGHEVPSRDADRMFLDLPLAEVANLRAGDR